MLFLSISQWKIVWVTINFVPKVKNSLKINDYRVLMGLMWLLMRLLVMLLMPLMLVLLLLVLMLLLRNPRARTAPQEFALHFDHRAARRAWHVNIRGWCRCVSYALPWSRKCYWWRYVRLLDPQWRACWSEGYWGVWEKPVDPLSLMTLSLDISFFLFFDSEFRIFQRLSLNDVNTERELDSNSGTLRSVNFHWTRTNENIQIFLTSDSLRFKGQNLRKSKVTIQTNSQLRMYVPSRLSLDRTRSLYNICPVYYPWDIIHHYWDRI